MKDPQDPKGQEGAVPFKVPQPAVLKVGVSHKGGALPHVATQLLPGAAMDALLPQWDLKSVRIVAYEPALKRVEVKDKRGGLVRLLWKGPAAFSAEWVVGRDKPQTVILSLQAGAQIAPALAAAVEQASPEPRLADHADDLLEWVTALAEASGVTLGGAARWVTSAAVQAQQGEVAFASTPAQAWGGFTGQGAPKAPPARRPAVIPGKLEDVLLKAAPGLDLDTVDITHVVGSRGFVLLGDAAQHEVAVQQTKFSQPPMFGLEYRAPTGKPTRITPLGAPLCHQLAAVLEYCLEVSPRTDAEARAVNLIRAALLKVL